MRQTHDEGARSDVAVARATSRTPRRWWPYVGLAAAAVATVVYLARLRPDSAVHRPAASAPATSPAPSIVTRMPSASQVSVSEGESVDFELGGAAADGLATVWFVDGREVARGSRWRLDAESPGGPAATLTVEGELTNRAGAATRARWTVDVAAKAPRIVRSEPSDTHVRTRVGDPGVFTADAVSGNAKPVQFDWTLDGGAVVRTSVGRYLPPADLRGEHRLEVAAVDSRDLRSTPHAWTIVSEAPPSTARPVESAAVPASTPRLVEPPAAPASAPRPPPEPAAVPARADAVRAPAPPVETAAVPRTQPIAKTVPAPVAPSRTGAEPPAGAPTETEVREWLGRVERAYEARDSAAIVDLGVVRPDQLGSLQQQISRYRHLEVDIENEQISIDGDAAVVSFTRTDRDETGRSLDLPRQTFRLVRGPHGLTARPLQ